MLSGEDLRTARERAGLTQSELAQRLGVSMRSVGNWERGERMSRRAETRARDALADHMTSETGRELSLSSISDARLLAEIARRFDRARPRDPNDGTATTRAGESPARDEQDETITVREVEGEWLLQPEDAMRD